MDIIFSDFIASLISFTLKSRITLHARFCNLNILSLLTLKNFPRQYCKNQCAVECKICRIELCDPLLRIS